MDAEVLKRAVEREQDESQAKATARHQGAKNGCDFPDCGNWPEPCCKQPSTNAQKVDALLKANKDTWFLIAEIHASTGMPKASCKRYMLDCYRRDQVMKRKSQRGHKRAFEYKYRADYKRKYDTFSTRPSDAPGGTDSANAAQGKGGATRKQQIRIEFMRW